jgi:hypothetical protein
MKLWMPDWRRTAASLASPFLEEGTYDLGIEFVTPRFDKLAHRSYGVQVANIKTFLASFHGFCCRHCVYDCVGDNTGDAHLSNGILLKRMIDALKARLAESFRFQLTTDGFVPYIGAVEHAWGADAPDFGQLVKLYGASLPGPARYSPPKILEAVPTVIHGTPDPALISTSFIERQNLTVRMACRRFTRLTNGFSKKLENLKAALAVHFAWYNLVRIHRTLRVTPATAAGVTIRAWDLAELLG